MLHSEASPASCAGPAELISQTSERQVSGILVPEGGLSAARDLLLISPITHTQSNVLPLPITAAVLAGITLLVLSIVIVIAFA